MRAKRTVTAAAAISLGALAAALAAGCDDGSTGAEALYGTWQRQKIYQPGSAAGQQIDTWTITFREDGTFTSVHVHEETDPYNPVLESSARDGEFAVGEGGRISFSGGWAEDLSEVETLGDLAENYKVFTQQTMYVLASGGKVMFLGPDFDYDSVYIAGDSYDILFGDGGSAYSREANIVLTGGDGAVVEQRVEAFTYSLIDASACSVAYSFDNVSEAGPSAGSGTATDCTYVWTEGRTVEGLDGADAIVDTMQFVYTIGGVEKDEDFAIVGDVLISFTEGFETKVLVNNAYEKVSD